MALESLASQYPVDAEVKKAQVYPEQPYLFPETLRGRRNRWYKPLISLVLGILFYLLFSAIFIFASLFIYIEADFQSLISDFSTPLAYFSAIINDTSNPTGVLILLSSVALLIPSVLLSNRIVFGQSPGTMASVEGRLRLNFLIPAIGIALVVTLLPIAVEALLVPETIYIKPKSDFWLLLVVLIVFVPLQVAAEEYTFRGWLVQNIGSWFKNPRIGMTVSTVVIAGIFALLHGTSSPTNLAFLVIFAVVAAILVWVTGGIEASLALHFAHNFITFVFDGLSGGISNSLAANVESTVFEVVAASFTLIIVAFAIYAFYRHLEKRGKITRWGEPQTVEILDLEDSEDDITL